MVDTPSQEIINAAKVTVTATDARGRAIGVRKLKTLDRMRLFEMIGADNSENEPYLGCAMLAYCVTSIDGQAVPMPRSKLALEAIVQQLDDDGFAAVAQAISENFLPPAASADEVKEAIKNG